MQHSERYLIKIISCFCAVDVSKSNDWSLIWNLLAKNLKNGYVDKMRNEAEFTFLKSNAEVALINVA